jgi:hypothetical protein
LAKEGVAMEFMEHITPIVDETIRTLAAVRFVEDPIAGVRYSRATSIISSAYKRHGRILELALRESLRESNRHKVWHDDVFKVSREADALASTQDLLACLQTTLPYGNSVRTLQVDMIAFDGADQSIRANEIKRGNGQFDAGKIRSITRDLTVGDYRRAGHGFRAGDEARAVCGFLWILAAREYNWLNAPWQRICLLSVELYCKRGMNPKEWGWQMQP